MDKEKPLENLRNAMLEHQRKTEAAPEYRKLSEKITKWVETVGFGNDTID